MAGRSDDLTLEMTRVVAAAPSVVFAAFSDGLELAGWWGPKGFTTPSIEFEPRVGEIYRIEMQPPEGDHFYLTGVFSAHHRRSCACTRRSAARVPPPSGPR